MWKEALFKHLLKTVVLSVRSPNDFIVAPVRSAVSYEGRFAGLIRTYLQYYQYYADAGQANYFKHRANCHSKGLLQQCWLFFSMLRQALKKHVRVDSIDSFVHRFRRNHLGHPCPSTSTVYRYIDKGMLDLDNTDLPVKLRCRVKRARKAHARTNKRNLGTSIDERPDAVDERLMLGDWEG